jgi:hypothetical protein
MAEGVKKWVNVPVSDVINTRTGPVADLLDGTIHRLSTIATGRVQAFMDGQAAKMPSELFYTDLRTAINALETLRKVHF